MQLTVNIAMNRADSRSMSEGTWPAGKTARQAFFAKGVGFANTSRHSIVQSFGERIGVVILFGGTVSVVDLRNPFYVLVGTDETNGSGSTNGTEDSTFSTSIIAALIAIISFSQASHLPHGYETVWIR